jgi:predicted  nucleic acid-binding Zn-ribbon protein
MDKTNSHRHKCAVCGFVWRHANESPGRDNDVAHTCRCGNQQFFIYRGEDKAQVATCGRPCRQGDRPVLAPGVVYQAYFGDLHPDNKPGDL